VRPDETCRYRGVASNFWPESQQPVRAYRQVAGPTAAFTTVVARDAGSTFETEENITAATSQSQSVTGSFSGTGLKGKARAAGWPLCAAALPSIAPLRETCNFPHQGWRLCSRTGRDSAADLHSAIWGKAKG
jgi:hypothetical protein